MTFNASKIQSIREILIVGVERRRKSETIVVFCIDGKSRLTLPSTTSLSSSSVMMKDEIYDRKSTLNQEISMRKFGELKGKVRNIERLFPRR